MYAQTKYVAKFNRNLCAYIITSSQLITVTLQVVVIILATTKTVTSTSLLTII